MVPAPSRGYQQMTNLSETQTIILSAAARRSDGTLLPLPDSLRPSSRRPTPTTAASSCGATG